MLIAAVLSAFVLGAVVCDLTNHRLPNYYQLCGLVVSFIAQLWGAGLAGLEDFGAGLLTGFALFFPLYALGGMAAGDVKLMAVVGSFFGAAGAMWAALFSLIAGGVFGVLYLVNKGQLGRMLGRYWAMASLRSYIPAEDNDAARHRFPYAVAIAAGTLLSLYWTPI